MYTPCGMRELLIREVHGGSLADHFGENKTLIMFREHYYWLGIKKDVPDVSKVRHVSNGEIPSTTTGIVHSVTCSYLAMG